MVITRSEIIAKTFTRSYLGYDDEEVDSFLDEIMIDVDQNAIALETLKEENEKLKMHINRLMEEMRTSSVGRNDIVRLKEENEKLTLQLAETTESTKREMKTYQNELSDAKEKACGILDAAQKKAQETLSAAENRAAELTFNAQEEAKAIAHSVQEREREIMDRAQRRARNLIDSVATGAKNE